MAALCSLLASATFRSKSSSWAGRTIFHLLRKPEPPSRPEYGLGEDSGREGYRWQQTRLRNPSARSCLRAARNQNNQQSRFWISNSVCPSGWLRG